MTGTLSSSGSHMLRWGLFRSSRLCFPAVFFIIPPASVSPAFLFVSLCVIRYGDCHVSLSLACLFLLSVRLYYCLSARLYFVLYVCVVCVCYCCTLIELYALRTFYHPFILLNERTEFRSVRRACRRPVRSVLGQGGDGESTQSGKPCRHCCDCCSYQP